MNRRRLTCLQSPLALQVFVDFSTSSLQFNGVVTKCSASLQPAVV